jgi:hypothetical protein
MADSNFEHMLDSFAFSGLLKWDARNMIVIIIIKFLKRTIPRITTWVIVSPEINLSELYILSPTVSTKVTFSFSPI